MSDYRPLPPFLTIKQSEIEGLGLFATEDIAAGTYLGITHLFFGLVDVEIVRTPLGGFYNHDETGNCYTTEIIPYGRKNGVRKCKVLYTARDIKAGEELTAKYTLYEVKGKKIAT